MNNMSVGSRSSEAESHPFDMNNNNNNNNNNKGELTALLRDVQQVIQ
jgi:hypothetical protein